MPKLRGVANADVTLASGGKREKIAEADAKEEPEKKLLQFFDNGTDKDSLACAKRLEAAGYEVLFAPTSGPSALWIGDHELVGYVDIHNGIAQLIPPKENTWVPPDYKERLEKTMAEGVEALKAGEPLVEKVVEQPAELACKKCGDTGFRFDTQKTPNVLVVLVHACNLLPSCREGRTKNRPTSMNLRFPTAEEWTPECDKE